MHAETLAGSGDAAPPSALQRAWQGWPGLALICTAGTLLSWAFTGHLLGRGNNIYHLPLLAGLAGKPGMADDAFVQALSGFQSGLWVLLTGSDAWLPAPLLLPLLLFATKALCLGALLGLAHELGLRGRRQQLAFVLTMACTPLLRGTSYAGHGGLFIDYFSHSELATGASLLMVWACLRRRFDIALALNGGVFFLNAFMAVWNLAPLLWLALRAWRADPPPWRQQRRGLLAGAAVAALLAAPLLWRAVAGGQLGTAALTGVAGSSHRQFLRDYYPYHFLASEMPLAQWLGLAAVLLAAALGLRALGPAARGLRQVALAYGAVYAVGLVLPLLTDSPLLINLHLLRCSVYFHFIAALVLGVWLLRALQSAEVLDRSWRAPWLAVALLTVRPALLALPLALLVQRASPALRRASAARLRPLAVAVFGLALLGGGGAFVAQQLRLAQLRASVADWAQLARAVRAATPPGALVMVPLGTDDWQPADAGSGAFQYHAERPVWIDDRRGATVFWRPGYRALWEQRRGEQRQLADWPARLAYAGTHGIAVVVDDCSGLPASAAPLARAGRLCAVRAAPPP